MHTLTYPADFLAWPGNARPNPHHKEGQPALAALLATITDQLPETITLDTCGTVLTATAGPSDSVGWVYRVAPTKLHHDGRTVTVERGTLGARAYLDLTVHVRADLDAPEVAVTTDWLANEPLLAHACATTYAVHLAAHRLAVAPEYQHATTEYVAAAQESLASLALLTSPEFTTLTPEQRNAARQLVPGWTGTPGQLAASVRLATSM